MDRPSQKKPLCYDPVLDKFIYYQEIITGKEKIIPVDSLSDDDFKKLVIKRVRSGPEITGGPMTSPFHSRENTIKAIKDNTKFGQQTLEAEKSILRDLLAEIERNLE
jgi:hypothetical protein